MKVLIFLALDKGPKSVIIVLAQLEQFRIGQTGGEMDLQLDGSDRVPVYRQIVDAIKHQVAIGVLPPGTRLPTLRQLAFELHVDRNTIVRAYRVLDREGVISSQQGRGTFVKSHARHPELTRHRHESLELIVGEGIARALSLGYAPDEIERVFAKRLSKWRSERKGHRERQAKAGP